MTNNNDNTPRNTQRPQRNAQPIPYIGNDEMPSNTTQAGTTPTPDNTPLRAHNPLYNVALRIARHTIYTIASHNPSDTMLQLRNGITQLYMSQRATPIGNDTITDSMDCINIAAERLLIAYNDALTIPIDGLTTARIGKRQTDIYKNINFYLTSNLTKAEIKDSISLLYRSNTAQLRKPADIATMDQYLTLRNANDDITTITTYLHCPMLIDDSIITPWGYAANAIRVYIASLSYNHGRKTTQRTTTIEQGAVYNASGETIRKAEKKRVVTSIGYKYELIQLDSAINTTTDDMTIAIDGIADGQHLLRLLSGHVTRRQYRILELVQRGYTPIQIAEYLNISASTVYVQLSNIRQKLIDKQFLAKYNHISEAATDYR